MNAAINPIQATAPTATQPTAPHRKPLDAIGHAMHPSDTFKPLYSGLGRGTASALILPALTSCAAGMTRTERLQGIASGLGGVAVGTAVGMVGNKLSDSRVTITIIGAAASAVAVGVASSFLTKGAAGRVATIGFLSANAAMTGAFASFGAMKKSQELAK
ncbi:MAG: hypothetical protein H7338_11205 [Candidatus Sericytochromatia bacterium]|nr:hypothetical protein [Candidatus Sericytochromatia bacterium]